MNMLCTSTLFFLVVGSYAAAVPKCHMEQLMNCGEPLREFREEVGSKFPTNEAQVVSLCSKLDEASACVDKFKKQCMTPTQLQIMKFVTEGAYAVYQDFCTPGSDIRADYLEHAGCINSAYESDDFKNMASYVEAGLETLSTRQQNERLPAACCSYKWMDKNMRAFGIEKCGEEAVDSFERVSMMAVSTLPDMFCNGFDPESDQCKSVLPAPGSKPTGELRNSQIAKTFSALYLD